MSVARLIVVFSIFLNFPNVACAGGLIGDLVNKVAPGVGTQMDDAHRRAKEALPPYKTIEEGGSGLVRKSIEELNGETAGPMLAEWIRASRRNVISAGVGPIPEHIKEGLRGFVPESILNTVRYRSGWGSEVALPALSFRFGDAVAITLDDIIMFRSEDDAQTNLSLWAHELRHVMQYKEWGINDFAKRYVKNHQGVEQDAEDFSGRFAIWYNQTNGNQASTSANWGQVTQNMPQQSNICRTAGGSCLLPGFGPLGMSCYCNSIYGPIWGGVAP